MTARICAADGCPNPLVQRENEPDNKYRRRQTCCRACSGTLSNQKRHDITVSWSDIPWPRVTGEMDWANAFAAHNLAEPEGRRFFMCRPETHVGRMSTMAMVMEMGEWATSQ